MKIIINTPFISSPAGVSNHYLGLKDYFSDNVIYNQYWTGNFIRRNIRFKILYKPLRFFFMFFDIIKFIFFILVYRRPIILLNPSFGHNALKRDAYFLRIGKFFGCKVAVFIHGWDKTYLEKVFKKEESFSCIWYKADAFFVLANEFKRYLQQLGVLSPIYLTTTKVDDKLLEDKYEKKIEEVSTILFLARVEKTKGIYTTIEAFEILVKKYPEMSLRIVGGGEALEEAKIYIAKKQLRNVYFTGPLKGKDLQKEFLNADLYILPTTHGEGMPTSVLEAMAFGLPVITRPVGGLVDFFEDDSMGYLIESLNPKDYAEKIELLINDIEKTNSISYYNIQYAKDHFLASKVAQQLESILLEIK